VRRLLHQSQLSKQLEQTQQEVERLAALVTQYEAQNLS
jgi:hypothetical protein